MLLLWVTFPGVKGQVVSIETPQPYAFEKERVTIQSIGNPGQAQQIPQSSNPLAHIPGASGLPKGPSTWMIDQHTATTNDPLAFSLVCGPQTSTATHVNGTNCSQTDQ